MEIDRQLVRRSRQDRGWTQQQLAEIANLSLRTVQRVENQGVGSHETVSALIAVLEVQRDRLLAPAPVAEPGQARTSPLLLSTVLALGMALGSTAAVVFMNLIGG